MTFDEYLKIQSRAERRLKPLRGDLTTEFFDYIQKINKIRTSVMEREVEKISSELERNKINNNIVFDKTLILNEIKNLKKEVDIDNNDANSANFLINNLSRWKTIITGMSTLKKKKIKTLIK